MTTASIPTGSHVIKEPTAWLRTTSRRRVIRLSRQRLPTVVFGSGPPLVVAYLTNHVEPGSREDRTCDRCGTYCPLGSEYRVSTYLLDYRERRYFLVFGLCVPCGLLEHPDDQRLS